MRSRLNITVDEALAAQVKRYAARHDISVSRLVEQYFQNLTRPAHKKNIPDMVKKLPKPAISVEAEGKEAYYRFL